PSPSRATCSARLASTASNDLRNAGSRGSDVCTIFGAPRMAAAPVANASRVSEVEVSPSTVTALKLSATPCLSKYWSTRDEIGASVKTKESIVPMSGAIIPAPLAMPQMVTGAAPIRAMAAAPLGNVSVVMMALAASCQALGAAVAIRRSMTAPNLFESSGSPITPVDPTNTCERLHPADVAAMFAVSLVSWRPDLPVKALALPELTTSALAAPALSCARHQSTGAEGHFERVKTPATAVP